jgi:peroxiredoxin
MMNGLLIRQNLQLRQALQRFEPPARLKAGDVLESFTAGELHGSTLAVKYDHGSPRRVLLFFSPHCPYCTEQFASWRSIIDQAPSKGFQVLALVKDTEEKSSIEKFLASVNCPPESEAFHIGLISEDIRHKYKFMVTPTTLVVSNVGIIENVWNGKLSPADIASANASLGINISQ